MPKLSKHTVFTPNGAKAVQLVRENPNTPNRKEKEMSNRIKKQFWFTPEEEAWTIVNKVDRKNRKIK